MSPLMCRTQNHRFTADRAWRNRRRHVIPLGARDLRLFHPLIRPIRPITLLDIHYFVCLNSLMKPIAGDILRGHLDTLILAALDRGEAYGYDIMQRLNTEGQGAFAMREGTIYPVLYRLESKGLIRARWESGDAPRKGPRKRLYRLSSSGKKALAARRKEWEQFVAVIGRIVEA